MKITNKLIISVKVEKTKKIPSSIKRRVGGYLGES
ncbi:hypothetical protein NRS6108_04134 [Bacillus subtilis]|nr:hypothetical protein NRS6108_04134 [Bacillus subtilis]